MSIHKNDTKGVRDGLSLIEVIIGLAIVGVLVLSYGTALSAAVASRRIKIRNMAAALADIQLSTLRAYDPSQVPVQTNGEPYGVLFSEGNWSVQTDASAYSGTRVFHTDSSQTSGITSVYPLPRNAYGDFTLTAQIKIDASSPSSWKTGFLFRSRDLQNGYRVYLTSSSLVLERVVGGTVTTLYSDVRSVNKDTWYKLKVTATGTAISVELGGVLVTNQTDSTYSVGMATLASWNGAETRFDDIDMNGTLWNMDTESLGAIPNGWERFGLSDLSAGAMTLTASELYGESGFKHYTATVTWQDGSVPKSLTQSTDVGN